MGTSKGLRGSALVVLVLALPACGGARTDRIPRDLTGHAQAGCAPADGPAVEIHLSAGAVPDDDGRVVRVLVWQSVDRLRGRRFVFRGDDMRQGEVAVCTAGGDCTRVVRATFRFDRAAGRDLAGNYEIEPSDGTVQAGRFRTRWVERQIYCI